MPDLPDETETNRAMGRQLSSLQPFTGSCSCPLRQPQVETNTAENNGDGEKRSRAETEQIQRYAESKPKTEGLRQKEDRDQQGGDLQGRAGPEISLREGCEPTGRKKERKNQSQTDLQLGNQISMGRSRSRDGESDQHGQKPIQRQTKATYARWPGEGGGQRGDASKPWETWREPQAVWRGWRF